MVPLSLAGNLVNGRWLEMHTCILPLKVAYEYAGSSWVFPLKNRGKIFD
jgi:hypothetical protein